MLPITFTDEDFKAFDLDQDNLMVISIELVDYGIEKVLVDQGSSVNIFYWKTFRKMDIFKDLIVPYNKQIFGFSSEWMDTHKYLDLRTRIKSRKDNRDQSMLLVGPTHLTMLLGLPCLNAFNVIVPTPHLTMTFPSNKGEICIIHADHQTI